jgi:hypothetical protein
MDNYEKLCPKDVYLQTLSAICMDEGYAFICILIQSVAS